MSIQDAEKAIEEVRLVAEGLGYDDVPTRIAWVLRHGEHHFEQVAELALWGCQKSDNRLLWIDRFRNHHQDKDIFTTELAARNELEQRLYTRLLNLQKHREAMTMSLISCAFPAPEEVGK